jgi:hypothetical protein
MFADDIPEEWILRTLAYCKKHTNTYLFQSKNPARMSHYLLKDLFPENSIFCTTIETNRRYPEMGNTPDGTMRANYMRRISYKKPTYVTIEPIMDFDIQELVNIIITCQPTQVNIGADSGNNNLHEPSKEKILALIGELKKFTTIDQKRNLSRILDAK